MSIRTGKKRKIGRTLNRTIEAAGKFLGKRRPGTLIALSSAVAGVVALFRTGQAQAATITWSTAGTISADTDIFNVGATTYAYDETNVATTVNGVTFAAGNSASNLGSGNITMSGLTSMSTSYSYPTGLSASYQNLTKGGAYNSGAAATITLNNLLTNHVYATQVWVNDSRTGTNRTETLTSGLNTVTLNYNTTATAGGAGQYSIGRFVANASTQTFTMQGNASTQLNAIQVRDVTGVWSGQTDGNWADGTANFTNGNTWTTVSGLVSAAYFADTDGFKNAVTNSTVAIQSGGVSTGSVNFQNNTVTYTLTGGAITGTTAVNVLGSGKVIFNSTTANSYSGTTTISGGTLQIGNGGTTGTLGSGTVSVGAAGTLMFNRTDTYTLATGNTVTGAGDVALASGTVATAVNGQFNTTGDLVFGSAARSTTVASLDLTNFSSTFGGLNVQTNSASANTITIGSGKTLTINGNVKIGADGATTTVTKLNVAGASGTLNVVKSGGTFQMGAATGSSQDSTTVDLSGLGTLSVDLGSTGLMRLGDQTTSSVGSTQTLYTSPTTTIKTGTLAIGDNSSNAGLSQILMGNGTQVIQANTINIGLINSTNRSYGKLAFNTGTPSGTIKIRGYGGTDADLANLNMLVSNTATGTSLNNVFDVSGHSADLKFDVVNMMQAGNPLANYASTLTFDTGTMNINTLKIGTRTGGSSVVTPIATVNIGSGTGNYTNTADLGAVTMASNTSTVTGAFGITGALNIDGDNTTVSMTSLNIASASAASGAGTANGSVTIAGGSVTDTGGIVLASRSGGNTSTVTGTLTISGGSLSVGGDITTSGTVTSTLTLNGGLLDMGLHAIGVSGGQVGTLNFQGGTLQYVGSINGSGGLTKTTSGTLLMAGTNTYTGATTVSAGTLKLGSAWAIGNGTSNTASLTVSSGAVLDLNGQTPTAGVGLTIIGTGISSGGALTNSSSTAATYSGLLTLGAAASIIASGGDITLSNTGSITGAYGLTVGGAKNTTINGILAMGAGTLTKQDAGILTLTGANTYTGATTVSGGTLALTGNRTAAATGGFVVGNTASGTATLNVSNGTFTTGAISVGQTGASAAGIVNQTGGSLTMSGNQLLLGNSDNSYSTGTYNLSGGTLTGSGSGNLGVTLGVNVNTTGVFTLSGAGVLNLTGTNALQVGRNDASVNSSNGTFTQTGGSATVAHLGLGNKVGSNLSVATMNLSGGTFSAAAIDSLGAGNSNTVTMNISGSADVTLPALPTTHGGGSTVTLTFDGGTLRPYASSNTYISGLTAAYVKAGGARFDVGSGKDITVSQALLTDAVSTGGGLTKDGVGALTLSGVNTFTGGTTINGGTLAIGGSGSLGSGSYAGNITNTATLSYSSSANQTLSGVISGSGSLVKSGAASLTLSGANTFSGGVSLSAGTLVVGSSSTPTSGTLTSGPVGIGTLTLGGGQLTNSGVYTIGNAVVVTGSTTTNVTAAGVNLTLTGAITGSGTFQNNRVSASGSVIVQGDISGFTGTFNYVMGSSAGNFLTFNGTTTASQNAAGAKFSLSGATSGSRQLTVGATGATTFQLGELSGTGGQIGGGVSGTTLQVGALNSTSSFSGVLIGSNLALNKVGSGMLTLSSTNTYTGGTTVSGGTLSLGNASNTLADTGVVTVNGGTLDIGANSDTVGAVTLTNGSITGSSGTLTGSSYTAVNGLISANLGGTGSLTKSGSGTATLTGNNSFSGGVILNGAAASTLNINSATALGTGTFSVGSGALGKIDNTSGSAITLTTNNAQTWNADFAFVGSNDLDMGTGAVTLGGNRSIGVTAGNLTIGGAIGGAFSLTKTGAGTLTLGGNSSFTGNVTLGAANGDIVATNSGSFGVGPKTVSVIGNTGTNRPSVILDGSGGDLTFASNITFITSNDSLTDPAILSTAGNNRILGALQLTGGGGATAVVVNSDSLELGSITSIYSASGRSLYLGGAGDGLVSGVISNGSNTVSIEKYGSGKWTLAGTNTYTGTTIINGGTLQIGNGGSIGKLGSGAVTNNAAMVFNRIDTYGGNVANAIGGTGTVTLTSGTLRLTGSSTYTGATIINGGTLAVNGSLGNTAVAVNSGGTLGGTGTIAGSVTVNSGGHLAPGNSPGALIINNTLTLNSGSVSDFEIASTSSYDQVTGLTGLSYGGTLNVTGTIASTAHVYTLFSTSSHSGSFDTVNLASAPTGYRWHDYDALTAGIQGFDYTTGQIQLELANSAAVKLGLVANALSGSLRSDTTDENDENGMNAAGSIHVTGSNGRFVSEIDGLTNEAGVHDFADGYVQVDNDLSPAPTLVMLWLKDANLSDGTTAVDVISSLSANAGGAYTVLTSSDAQWTKLASVYSGFSTIIEFNSTMGTGDAFSWKFEGDFATITVDKVAVVPEPGSLGLLGLGALGLMGSRRRKSKKVAGESALSRFYGRRPVLN